MPTIKDLRESVALAKARLAVARQVVMAEKYMLNKAREDLKAELDFNKRAKAAMKADVAAIKAAKKAEKIAALEAKLMALKNPVGTKALKANRKPGRAYSVKAAEATLMAA